MPAVQTLKMDLQVNAPRTRPRRVSRPIIVFSSTAVVSLAAILATVDLSVAQAQNDGAIYTRMVIDPASETAGPFAYRILTPTIARAIPFPAPVSLALVTVIGLSVAAALLDSFLRPVVGDRLALVGLALVASGQMVWQSIQTPAITDAVSFAIIAGVFVALQKHAWWWIPLLLAVGMLNHELVGVLLLVVMVTMARQRSWGPLVASVAAVVGAYALIHATTVLHPPITSSLPLVDIDYWRSQVHWVMRRNGRTIVAALVHEVVWGLGATVLLAPFGYSRAPQLARDSLLLMPPVLALFAVGSDWFRMIMPLFPMITMMACVAVSAAAQGGCAAPTRTDGGSGAASEDHDEDIRSHEFA